MSDERYIKLLTEINKYGLDKGCAVEVMAVHNATGQTVKQLCGMHEKKVLQQLIEGYLFQKEQRSKLEAENAALRERLEKMIELPCKIGDKFYVVNDCPPEIKEHECCAFTFTEDGQVVIIDGLDCHYSVKIVCLSKEDAEAHLKELELIYNDKEITNVD